MNIYIEVINAFRRTVEQGVYAFEEATCQYYQDGNSCVVGWWLRDKGTSVEVMAGLPNSGAEELLDTFSKMLPVPDEAGCHVLMIAQCLHDSACANCGSTPSMANYALTASRLLGEMQDREGAWVGKLDNNYNLGSIAEDEVIFILKKLQELLEAA